MVTGKVLGRTTLEGRSVDSRSNKVYSSDTAEVEIVNLKGIKIISPLTHILSNERMPLRAVGVTSEGEIDTSFLLGGIQPIMSFEWSTSNKECGDLVHPFQVRISAVHVLLIKSN